MFEEVGLVDVESTSLRPTSQNCRSGTAGVAKWLDWFLLNEELMLRFEKFKSWIGPKYCLDHCPIWLKLEGHDSWKPVPFKFNHIWNQDEDFKALVLSSWVPFNSGANRSALAHLTFNLKKLKMKVKPWEKDKDKFLNSDIRFKLILNWFIVITFVVFSIQKVYNC